MHRLRGVGPRRRLPFHGRDAELFPTARYLAGAAVPYRGRLPCNVRLNAVIPPGHRVCLRRRIAAARTLRELRRSQVIAAPYSGRHRAAGEPPVRLAAIR